MPRHNKTDKERLLEAVVIDASGCHLFMGTMNRGGYGKFSQKGVYRPAHRVAYEIFVGEIPAGAHICHHCDVRHCVNPAHLYAGSAKTNMADMHNRGRNVGRRKLTDMQVRVIQKLLTHSALSQEAIAEPFGISQITVSRISLGKRNYLSRIAA